MATRSQGRLRDDIPVVDAFKTSYVVGTVQEIEHISTENCTEKFSFTITPFGCEVNTPYCKVHCPPGAVENDVEVTMTPLYYPEDASGEIFITPHVQFSACTHTFDKDVTVSLYTSYEAADITVPVTVQIKRKDGETTAVIQEVLLKNERFIKFTCRQFCRLGGGVTSEQCPNLKRRYYCAAYVQRERTQHARILHWMIYEDVPDTRCENRLYLENKNTIIDPECFTVGHPYKLQPTIISELIKVDPANYTLQLGNHYGQKVDMNYHFCISHLVDITPDNIKLDYTVHQIDSTGGATPLRPSRPCFLIWKAGATSAVPQPTT